MLLLHYPVSRCDFLHDFLRIQLTVSAVLLILILSRFLLFFWSWFFPGFCCSSDPDSFPTVLWVNGDIFLSCLTVDQSISVLFLLWVLWLAVSSLLILFRDNFFNHRNTSLLWKSCANIHVTKSVVQPQSANSSTQGNTMETERSLYHKHWFQWSIQPCTYQHPQVSSTN